MIQRLSHATVYVLNQDEAKDFYVNKLGFDVRTDISMEGFRWLTVGPKGQPDLDIVLMNPAQGPADDEIAAKILDLVKAGAMGTGVMATDDCRATYEELKARGVEFVSEPQQQPYGIEAVFKDNSGNWFSLTAAGMELVTSTEIAERASLGPPRSIARGPAVPLSPRLSGARWATWYSGLQLASWLAGHQRDARWLLRLDAARRFLRESSPRPVRLEGAARVASYSPHHFHRLFTAEYGLTPHAYLTRCRLEHAQRLLRAGDWSATEVCYAVGFRSLGSFTALFAREVGESPGRYARRFHRLGWDPWRLIPWCATLPR